MDMKAAKTAVITGAANGLGKALALALARGGWRIGLADIEVDEAENTLQSIKQSGGTGDVYRCDVRSHEEVQAMADHYFTSWGSVDLLVNNAGVYGTGSVGDVPLEDWERIIDTNLWGVVYGCHSFIPRMREQGSGHIVNIASSAGFVSAPETGPYSVSKAGVISLSEALRSELAPWGIGVTVVCPLFFNSHLFSTMSAAEGAVLTELSLVSAANSRKTADDIAAMLIESVQKNRLYLFPQISSRVFWLNKRLTPGVFHGLLGFLYGHGLFEKVLMRPARWGML